MLLSADKIALPKPGRGGRTAGVVIGRPTLGLGNSFRTGQRRDVQPVDCSRVIASIDGQVGIWETATGKLVKLLALPKDMEHGFLRGLACTPDLSLIAVGRTPGLSGFSPPHAHAIVWDVASGKVLQTVRYDQAIQVQSVALSHDGKWLATGGQQAGICVWEVRSGERLLALPNANLDPNRKHPFPEVAEPGASQVLCLGFSPDGQQLAIGDMFGVKLVDAKSGELLHQVDVPFRFGRSMKARQRLTPAQYVRVAFRFDGSFRISGSAAVSFAVRSLG